MARGRPIQATHSLRWRKSSRQKTKYYEIFDFKLYRTEPKIVRAKPTGMMLAKLTRDEVESEAFRIWNAFIELVAMNDYENLSPAQRPAYPAFWYESEVQNGDHLQYFENRGVKHLQETISALGLLGASCHQTVLKEAGEFFLAHPHEVIDSVEDYIAVALENEFGKFDQQFAACSPSLIECLEEHLKNHQSAFVAIS